MYVKALLVTSPHRHTHSQVGDKYAGHAKLDIAHRSIGVGIINYKILPFPEFQNLLKYSALANISVPQTRRSLEEQQNYKEWQLVPSTRYITCRSQNFTNFCTASWKSPFLTI